MKLLVSLLAASVMLFSVSTYGQTPTPIDSLPYRITTTGSFILMKDLNTTDPDTNAITITTANVTLDLNHHKLSNSNTASLGIGVLANFQNFIVIKNGTISGFRFGIVLRGNTNTPTGDVVEDVNIISPTTDGILVDAEGCLIKNNFFKTMQTGIWISHPYNQAVGNRIVHCTEAGIAEFLSNNTTGNYFEDNFLSQCNIGILATPASKLRFNTTVNCPTRFSGGGIDAGALNN
jgi:Periplasmic copper-binding protein (NosD)